MSTTEGTPGQRAAARAHVAQLRQDGGTYRSVAAAAALSTGSVHRLATGRRRAQPGIATAVLTVTSPALTQARLDAGGTRLRLRALHVMGHGSARIARAVGAHPVAIRKLVRGDARTVSQRLRDAIAELYDAWWDKRAPGRGAIILTPAEVSAVFAAADIAADDKRYRIEMCPDCPDQSCPACQTHLRDAEAFDRIADRMLQAARTAKAADHGYAGPPGQSRPAADKEAGQ